MRMLLLLGAVIPLLPAASLAQAPKPPCELICLPPERCICEPPPPSPPCSLVCADPGERLESVECKCVKDER
jgi:hypothetical protein